MKDEYLQYLAHHGIKGQKWGVRRFQNPDGTLINPKGRKKEKKVAESDTWDKKESKWLSDEELNRRNNRMQREQQYRQNIDNRHPVKKELKNLATDSAKKIFIATAVALSAVAMKNNYSKIIKSGGEFIKRAGASGFFLRNIGRGARWL